MSDGQIGESEAGENQFRWFKRMKLLSYRKRRGLTQAAVAAAIYRSPDSVRDYEKGKAKIPAACITDLLDVLDMSEDDRKYMRVLAPYGDGAVPIEADGRLNALYLALCDEYMGDIFEWNPVLIGGPLQTDEYHEGPGRAAATNPTKESMESGRVFKQGRGNTLRGRTDNPNISFLIGEAAFFFLSKEPKKLQLKQLDFLTAHADLPNWEIRVLAEPSSNGLATFSCYGPGDAKNFPNAGPKVVYTEAPHSSWVFQDQKRVAVYDDWRHAKWPRSIGFKEYRDAYWRDHLA